MNSRPLPPPPPSPAAKPSSELAALTARPFTAPTPMAPPVAPKQTPAPVIEELTSLADDDLEEWASSGTKIISKPTPAPSPVLEIAPPASFAATQAAAQPMMNQAPARPSPSYPPVAMSAYPQPQQPMMPSYAPPAKKTNWVLWAGVAALAAVFGLVAVGGAGGYYVYYQAQQQQAAAEEEMERAIATQQQAVDQTLTNPTQDQDDPNTLTPDEQAKLLALLSDPNGVGATTDDSTSAPVQTAPVVTAAPQHTAPVVAAPAKPAAKKGNGTLQTFAAGRGKPVFVDGTNVGVGGSRIQTSCGKHQIAVGSGRARIVDVPCDGTVTVGSPDGT